MSGSESRGREYEPMERGRFPPSSTQRTSTWVGPSSTQEPMPHLGHANHLCHLVESTGISIEEYKPLVENAKFLCRKCGRVAAKAENLCEPVPL